MLWTLFVILLVLWLLGVVSSYTMGGFIHILLVLAIPVLAVTAAALLAATVVWTVMVLVVLMVSGRHRMGRPPWGYGRRYGWGPPRGRPRGDWM